MQKLSELDRFKEHQNIVLEGFDRVSAEGFTQVPNFLLNSKDLSFAAKMVYAKLLSYAWNNNRVFPGQERMADEIGSSQQTVSRAILELETVGFLEITRRGQGQTNIYMLRHTITQKKRK
jgi:DNA-binding MarR family transcriptional regulator